MGESHQQEHPCNNISLTRPSPFVNHAVDEIITFGPRTSLPAHFTHWRFPIRSSYTVSPREKPNTLRLTPSTLNLTAHNGNYAGPSGQTFVARRQQDTLFTFSVDLDFSPVALEEEAGVTAFLTQNHHLDMGIVMLPRNASTLAALPGHEPERDEDGPAADLIPQVRFRGQSYVPVPEPIVAPVPAAWRAAPLTLEIKAVNMTHYSFSVGPAGARSLVQTVLYASNEPVSWGFTGESHPLLWRSGKEWSLTDVFHRNAAWDLQHQQWEERDHASLLLELAVPPAGPVQRLKTVRDGEWMSGIYTAAIPIRDVDV